MEEKASRKIVRTQKVLHMQEEADFVARRFRSKKNAVRGGLRKILTTDNSQHNRSHCSGNFLNMQQKRCRLLSQLRVC
jgi:hypothetical protein